MRVCRLQSPTVHASLSRISFPRTRVAHATVRPSQRYIRHAAGNHKCLEHREGQLNNNALYFCPHESSWSSKPKGRDSEPAESGSEDSQGDEWQGSEWPALPGSKCRGFSSSWRLQASASQSMVPIDGVPGTIARPGFSQRQRWQARLGVQKGEQDRIPALECQAFGQETHIRKPDCQIRITHDDAQTVYGRHGDHLGQGRSGRLDGSFRKGGGLRGIIEGASYRPWSGSSLPFFTQKRWIGGHIHGGAAREDSDYEYGNGGFLENVQAKSFNETRTQHLPICSQNRPRNDPAEQFSGRPKVEETVEDTIYALSTAPGKAAIAVIRISGPGCVAIYHSLCPDKPLPRPRFATVRTLHNPSTQFKPDDQRRYSEVLDSNSIVLYVPGPKSATGEDILELHVHGGLAIVKAVLKAIPGSQNTGGKIRYAEAGEFTRRAFLNGRLDLTQAEALGNALDAVTEQQRRQSLRGTAGRVAKHYEDWRRLLLYARGELEALIDFSEDQHFDESPAMLAASVAAQVKDLRRKISLYVENAVRGELLRSGISVALLGQPNAGKSSLLNLIVGREAAIVSREAGTTRDIVEVSVDLGGYLCRFSDTAGLRSATAVLDGSQAESATHPVGLVEQEGMARAKRRALESDVVIVLLSLERNNNGGVDLIVDHDVLETAKECAEQGAQVIIAINKSDLAPNSERHPPVGDAVRPVVERVRMTLAGERGPVQHVLISCKQAADATLSHHPGVKPLLNTLLSTFEQMTIALEPDTAQVASSEIPLTDNSLWQDSLGASERQRFLLEDCAANLDSFLARVNDVSGDDMDIVIAAESLRAAAECLARITGRGDVGDVEEVLGVVFEK